MANLKVASLVILAGSLLFIVAAVIPYTRVFIESDPDRKLEIIRDHKGQWNVGHVIFILASLLTVLGVVLMTYSYKAWSLSSWTWAGLAALLTGALLWSWHCTERLISPEGFVWGSNTPYLFVIYSALTMLGLLVTGFFLLGTDLAAWVGWMLVGGVVLIAILMILFKDMPPIVYYLLTLVLGIRLLIEAGRTPAG